ncbi:MAG: ATP cone domain-containing protein [Patescibacteria group bacterium]
MPAEHSDGLIYRHGPDTSPTEFSPKIMQIIKSTGETVEYDPTKIRGTLMRAGASSEMVERVLKRLHGQVHAGMTTKRLFTLIRRELRKEGPHLAYRYGLRTALLKLGPAGFKFERYVASILNAYQYQATVPEKDLVGLCVNHEVDVVAVKGTQTITIEAKFRNDFGDTVKLKDVMSAWARYIDLCEGAASGKKCPHFDELWIVTNGKFTDRALQFGTCKGMVLIGWSNGDSLAKMVDHATLYPITVLDGLRQWELDRFAERGIMLCREVAIADPKKMAGRVGLHEDRMQQIWKQCRAVMNGD